MPLRMAYGKRMNTTDRNITDAHALGFFAGRIGADLDAELDKACEAGDLPDTYSVDLAAREGYALALAT